MADVVADGLGALFDILADDDFAGDAGLFFDDGLFGGFAHFDGAFFKGVEVGFGGGPIGGAAFDVNDLLAELDLFGDRLLGGAGVDADATGLRGAFADGEFFVDDGDALGFVGAAGGARVGGERGGRRLWRVVGSCCIFSLFAMEDPNEQSAVEPGGH
jgi:hypothetical protein